jgi:hypothetical protein
LTSVELDQIVQRSEDLAATRERLLAACQGGGSESCTSALTSLLIPGLERYRGTLKMVVRHLAPTSRCLRGLDAHDAAVARHAQTARAILVAALDREYETAGELQRGEFVESHRDAQTAGMADFERCIPAAAG